MTSIGFVVSIAIITLCIRGYEQSILHGSPYLPPEDYDDYDQNMIKKPYGKSGSISPYLLPPPPHPVQNTQIQTVQRPTQSVIVDPGLNAIGQPKDGKDHPCYRTCKPGQKMTCYYRFHMEWYHSMSKACKNCLFNSTDCGNPDCVPANGVARTITVVNRKMPGPAIEVCQHDTVVVDVENSLMASGTTIHWHGLYMKETPYMDGVPFVTQCPIQPDSTFRYEFSAPQVGTYFWHSHIGLQRGDGVTGALIVREPKKNDPHNRLYHFDKSEHVMIVTDWINNGSISLFTDHHHSAGPNWPEYLLINGVGRSTVVLQNRTVFMKAPVFEVERNYSYRFRLINAEFLNCPVELSVDGHNITIISTDGSDLVPITASALVTYSGERYDFIVNANKRVDNYWIRVRALMACAGMNNTRQVAVLRYKGAPAVEPAPPIWNNIPGLVVNAVDSGEQQNISTAVSQMRSLKGNDASLKAVPDHKIYISFDMRLKNNTAYHRVPYYGTDQVNDTFWLYTPQLDHISMQMPESPLLVSRPSSQGFCNESTIAANCTTEYCKCPHVLQVKLNSVVEFVLIDEGTFQVNHPFHLHGHSFRVVGQRKLGDNTTKEEVKRLDREGRIARNLVNPPVKDTVMVPDGGYTIIRFVADNPGYWLFHCHIEFHAEIGMSLVVKVGEHENMKPVPAGFPQCGNYIGTNYKFVKDFLKNKQK